MRWGGQAGGSSCCPPGACPSAGCQLSVVCVCLCAMQAPGDAPTKIFDRTPNLQGAQIISYRVSPDAKWCVLIGITAGAPERCVHSPAGWSPCAGWWLC